MNNKNQIYKKQYHKFYLLAGVITLVCVAFAYYLVEDDFAQPPQKANADLPLDHVNPQEIWMSRLENEKQLIDKKMQYLEDLILETKKGETAKEFENHELRKELLSLKKELKQVSERPKIVEVRRDFHDDQFLESTNPNLTIQTQFLPPQPRVPITEIVIDEAPSKVLHVDRVIPSGTSVKALLVSSVDVPCGIYSSSDPQPVKLRILDDGRLPKQVRAKLKGGIVIASVYGDLSNERVYMRIERLTQVREDGNFIETEVTGYVSGEDGKYGVRGIVVDKSSKLIENAALSGFFSGVSQYFQASASRQNYNFYEPAACAAPYNVNACDMACQGGYQGVCGAFDMLTDYFIRRAEQIRPVIQVMAGRRVDITFTHNAELGDLYTKEKVKQVREKSREAEYANMF